MASNGMIKEQQRVNKAFKKERRRNAQALKVEQKNRENANYFWRCAQAEKINRDNGSYKKPSEASKEILFARQESSGINFSQYEKIEVTRSGPEGCESIPEMDNFVKLKSVLPKFLSNNLTNPDRMGYNVPTPIQRHCVPLSLAKTFDVMACAQTGSGKTVAFLVPLIAQITAALAAEKKNKQRRSCGDGENFLAASPSALIVSPTRELATQIELEAHKLTYSSPIQCVCVYGGASSQQQLALLAKGVDILIATPGRLNDFLSQRLITLRRVNFCVLDEADRMLDMGFEPQIREICERYDLPAAAARNTLMFSATFPVEVQKIAQKYMRPYVFVAVGRVGSTVSSITQRVVEVRANDKRLKLETIIPLIVPTDKTIVFCQKKHVATWVKNQLMRALPHVRVDAIHGDRSQSQREHALELFRGDRLDILVATDVAARGLDVPGISHVIQFDLPVSSQDFDSYVHRIGRTGRAGRLGLATALFVPGQEAKMGQNGALLKPLCELLVEGKQEIPDWLQALRGGSEGSRGAVQSQARQQGSQRQKAQQGEHQGQGRVKQPQRDVRSKANMVTVSSAVVNNRNDYPLNDQAAPKAQQQQQPQKQPRRQRDQSQTQRSSSAPLPKPQSSSQSKGQPNGQGQGHGQSKSKGQGKHRGSGQNETPSLDSKKETVSDLRSTPKPSSAPKTRPGAVTASSASSTTTKQILTTQPPQTDPDSTRPRNKNRQRQRKKKTPAATASS